MKEKCVPAGQKGKNQEEMFAMDTPEYEKVDKVVDLLVDSAVAECGDEQNAIQNTPSEKPEEELSRTHYDIAGYGDPEDEENEYPPGPNDHDEDMYGQDEMSMGEQFSQILGEKGEYHAFFKRMMDEEGISGIGQLTPDRKKDFFNKVSANWKKEKGESVAESFAHKFNLKK